MTTFEDRQKGYESKFVHDEQKLFKIRARRRKFLGLWAAEKMHKNEEDSLEYALEVVRFGVGNKTVNEIATKVHADLEASGVNVDIQEVGDKMVQLTEKAITTLEREGDI